MLFHAISVINALVHHRSFVLRENHWVEKIPVEISQAVADCFDHQQ